MRRLFDSMRADALAAHGLGARRKAGAAGVLTFVFLTFSLLALAAVSGCSTETRRHVMSVLFENLPAPGQEVKPKPVVRQPRRQPPKVPVQPVLPVEQAALPVVEPEEPAHEEWREFQQRMPKDAAGNVDWVRAIEEKIVEPRAGIDPNAAPQPVFPLDVPLEPAGQPLFKVTFPHKAHTEWLACANCHPAVFKMQRGGDPITMAKIFAGEYCGRCHGKVSFAVATGCPRCHLALAGPK